MIFDTKMRAKLREMGCISNRGFHKWF